MQKSNVVHHWKCDGCTKVVDSDNIYKFIGNVVSPCGGGLIGGNIFTDKTRNADVEEQRRAVEFVSTDETLRIYELMYCKTCIIRILELQPTVLTR